MRKKRIKRAIAAFVVLLAIAALMLNLNRIIASRYEILGADVSHWQGDVDFSLLEQQGVRFAFIKATEGSAHVDEKFEENLARVQGTDMKFGFYHFFSFDSPGETQAENYIARVPALENLLPPVIDVEYYGDYFRHPPEIEPVQAQLRAMIDRLEAHYGKKPILYATQRAYRRYIQGAFDDCDLWIRSVYLPPLNADWTFWQYTDRARLNGYSGAEKCINLNVFRGDAEAFARYCHS